MTVLKKEVLANFVPAAAVIRRGQALFIITGRKEHLGGSKKLEMKSQSLTLKLFPKLFSSSLEEDGVIHNGAIKCEDIMRSIKSEGNHLIQY